MVRNDAWREKAGKLDSTVAVGHPHHRNFDALIAQAGYTSGPLSLNRALPFQLETKLAKEVDHSSQVFNDDSDGVHAFEGHASQSTRC